LARSRWALLPSLGLNWPRCYPRSSHFSSRVCVCPFGLHGAALFGREWHAVYDRLWSESNHHTMCNGKIDVPMLHNCVYLVENNIPDWLLRHRFCVYDNHIFLHAIMIGQ
jgi:hypothetical protein